MDTRNEDDEIVPKEFLGYPERYGLQYKHTLSGIALILGGFGIFIGALLAILQVEPGDLILGIVLIVVGIPLLILSRIAYKRQRRQDDIRYLRYLDWKRANKKASDSTDSRPTDSSAAGVSVGVRDEERGIVPSESPSVPGRRRFNFRNTLHGLGFIVGFCSLLVGGLIVVTSESPENRWGSVIAAAGVLLLTLSYMGYTRQFRE